MKCWLTILLLLTACTASPSLRDSHRLIEWGWDTPKLQQIPGVLAQAQRLPFDGLVTDIVLAGDQRGLSWTIFSAKPVDASLLRDLAAQYRDLHWGRLTDNFLRLTVFPDHVDWFTGSGAADVWETINDNSRQVARLAQALGFKGIMLDVEQYGDVHLFDYSRQPDASQIAFEAYAQQVYQRGSAFMAALQNGYPGLTVMSTYFLTGSPSADPTRNTLLRPFLEGMVSAAADDTTLVDGYESSYIYKEAGQFQWARDQMLTQRPQYGQLSDFGHPVQVGFGLWIDPVCGEGGLPPEGCGFTPSEFTSALTSAINNSDRYVWIYSEKINWYIGQGIPALWKDALKPFEG